MNLDSSFAQGVDKHTCVSTYTSIHTHSSTTTTTTTPHQINKATLDLLRSEGMDNVVARHHRLAEGTRAAVEGWGLKLLCKHPRWNSDSLSVIAVPEGFDSTRIVKEAYARYNLSLGLGLSQVSGKVFRIGHLGNMDEVMMTSAISGAEMAMISAGLPITPGSGISRAIDYWQKTSKVIPTRECMLD